MTVIDVNIHGLNTIICYFMYLEDYSKLQEQWFKPQLYIRTTCVDFNTHPDQIN